MSFTESVVEEAALSWFEKLGYSYRYGPEIEPGELAAERSSFNEVILSGRFRQALKFLNPGLPQEALEEAFRNVSISQHATLIANNHAFHRMLVNGIAVECRRSDGTFGAELVRLLDFGNPEANDWLAVNQFTVVEDRHNRRADIVVLVNGLPLVVIELKNAADKDADIWQAFRQVETYKDQIPSLFTYNGVLVISDGLEARIGTISSNKEWFMPWRTIEGQELAPDSIPKLEVLLRGVFDKHRFLDLLRYFVFFEDDGTNVIKKLAGYHQFHAVNTAVAETIRASSAGGDKRIGVVWHTQGSGKSLSMAFYGGRIILASEMMNPTVVVLTDRNDLDNQLFGTFARCHELLRQKPVQADSRDDLKRLLSVAAGGVVFTTVQKFLPEEQGATYPFLSNRRNIVVIADEAHRSQYDFIDGFARHMRDALPNASFIGFTGTPIETTDANTRAVFGDYISVYDIQQAVEDGATVPIYYESRLAKLELSETERPQLDQDFDEATEGEETTHKERLKTKWAALEKLVGAEKRIQMIARDIIKHWESRLEAMEGKAMIVCMSRRICVELYDALVNLRPEWHSPDDDKGILKVVMTGSAEDPKDWQQHIRSKGSREDLAVRFKDPEDPFKLVIVRDMWLTGFDAPSLSTMYLDKPMRGHALMQAIARVNRVFRDKPGGLVVDYLGLAHELKEALATYTESGGKGKTALDQEVAVRVMLEKFEICRDFYYGFDRSAWTGGSAAEKLSLIPAAQEHILALCAKETDPEAHKRKFLSAVSDLSKAFALAVPDDAALAIRDDVGFFQAIRVALVKPLITERKQAAEKVDYAIRQIISRAVASDEVIDIFAAAGLKKPDISILSDQFLGEVREMPQRNLAVELLQKLLTGELKKKSRKFLIQSRSFSELLEASLRKYRNRSIEAAQVIEELIALAKELRAAEARGQDLGLTEDEVAFYDALETNDSAVKALGDENLRFIAQALVKTIRVNVSIDWTVKESVRARLRVMVKRVLRRYGYPPDKQQKAIDTIIEQAELLCADWGV